MSSKSKKKCRQYSINYLKYGFIASPANKQLPLCLICEQTLSNEGMKPSRLELHLKTKHAGLADKDEEYFKNLKTRYNSRSTVSTLFSKRSTEHDKGLVTSFNVSKLIAKCGKPHTIGETLIIPAVKEVLSTMIGPSASDIVKSIPLSNSSVQRRIDEMGGDIETSLCDQLKTTEFALQIDESTLRDNEALLMGYVRYINTNNEKCDDFLFAKPLVTDTKGSSIFHVVESFLNEKNIPLANIIACATDGAPSMIGRQRGFIAHLKAASPGLFAIHCIIHRQHLVAKHLNPGLHTSLQIVIKAVNRIKARSLNDRLFRKLCGDNDEHFERLLFHTEVRWLSKGNCLRRFMELFNTVVEFLESNDANLCTEVTERKVDIAYLTDVFEKLNEVNLKLQGTEMNLIKGKSIIAAFMAKLDVYISNLRRQELSQFPNLKAAVEGNDGDDAIPDTYVSHLENVKQDMSERFGDLTRLEIPD